MKDYDQFDAMGFNFTVDFIGKRRLARAGFQYVSGIKASTSIKEVPEGGLSGAPHQIPKGIRYEPIIMRRGMTYDGNLITAFAEQFSPNGTGISVTEDNLMIVKITTNSRSGQRMKTWELRNVIMGNFETGDWDALQSALMMESVTLYFNDVDVK